MLAASWTSYQTVWLIAASFIFINYYNLYHSFNIFYITINVFYIIDVDNVKNAAEVVLNSEQRSMWVANLANNHYQLLYYIHLFSRFPFLIFHQIMLSSNSNWVPHWWTTPQRNNPSCYTNFITIIHLPSIDDISIRKHEHRHKI